MLNKIKLIMVVGLCSVIICAPVLAEDNPPIKQFSITIKNNAPINLQLMHLFPSGSPYYPSGKPTTTPINTGGEAFYIYNNTPGSRLNLSVGMQGGGSCNLTPCVTYILDNGSKEPQGCQLLYWPSKKNECMVEVRPVNMGSGCTSIPAPGGSEAPDESGVCRITLMVNQ